MAREILVVLTQQAHSLAPEKIVEIMHRAYDDLVDWEHEQLG